eukprot:TRINITY_DN209_c0_g1_i17.p1 TRINITY_DN209_c0_g1~~TRINITY_DN209_c0_g1_i17.p1  ORF type:complete len:558 (-),score=183.70 TRINITY_DN209_c0_g1_i17:399-1853(-)
MAPRPFFAAVAAAIAVTAAAASTTAAVSTVTYDAGGTVAWTRPAAAYATSGYRVFAPTGGGGVDNTRLDAVYASSAFVWRGDLEFVLPVAEPGTYDVMLGFAELYWTAPGKRQFNILISGSARGGAPALTTLRTGFDIFAEAGAWRRATTVWANRLAVDGSGIRVRLQRVAGRNDPSINLLRVIPVDVPSTPPATATPPPPPTPTPTAAPTTPTPLSTAGGAWTAAPGFPDSQRRHENCFVAHRGRFYLIGGRGRRATMRYTPATGGWEWRAVPPQGPGGIHHMQCVAFGDHIYILAAFTGFFPQEPTVDRVLAYHPARDEWSTGATPIPAPHRRGAAAAVAYGDAIYVAGGNVGGHGYPHSTSQRTFSRFTPPAGGGPDGQWAALPAAPRARDHVSAVIVGSELLLAGGRDGGARFPFNAVVTEVDAYSFAAGTWRTLRSRLAIGRGAPVVGAIGGRVVIAGGEGQGAGVAPNRGARRGGGYD